MNETLDKLDFEEVLDLDVLTRFCEKFKVKFDHADITYERGFRELIYFFSDNLGGYSTLGIRNSLSDS